MKSNPINAFLCGHFFTVGYTMLRQDVMGLEKYIDHVRHNWWDISPAWGGALVVLCLWQIAKMHFQYRAAQEAMSDE